MDYSYWILLFMSVTEVVLLVVLIMFFARLKRSEHLLNELQGNQEKLLAKLHMNAELEQELMDSFAARQEELRSIDIGLEERSIALRKLMEQAKNMERSPQFLRELILDGNRKGKTPQQLAKGTGLSVDEVELILMQARR